jgi:hypothetical protein
MPKQPMRRSARGGRPYFFADAAIDKVLNMVVTLASEIWALRERQAALQAAGEARGTWRASEIDTYEFPESLEQQLAAERKEFIDNLFRVLSDVGSVPHASRPKARARRAAGKRPSTRRNSRSKQRG